MKRALPMLALVWTGCVCAATPPFVQVEPVAGFANTCASQNTAHATVRVTAELPAGTSWTYSIGYVYTTNDGYYGETISYDYYTFMSPAQNGPFTANAATLDIGAPSSWYGGASYPGNTEVLLIATTYSGPNGTGQMVGSYRLSWNCSSGGVMARLGSQNSAGAAPPETATHPVVEFYNAALDHYFISAAPVEIGNLDSGATKGWTRTGQTFNSFGTQTAGASPVCRFYLPPGNGDSHFFSGSPAECAQVQAKFPTFTYEAPDVFYTTLPDTVTGVCPPFTRPVYRLWNGRADSNHRYTTDPAIVADMVARGYVREGYGPDAVIMCAPL
jgi:hypothetical protein